MGEGGDPIGLDGVLERAAAECNTIIAIAALGFLILFLWLGSGSWMGSH